MNVYRFFEHFDLPNVAAAPWLMDVRAIRRRARDAAVQAVHGGEDVVCAVLAAVRCGEFWRRELGERHWLKLQKVIPYTWIMDPAPLPHHAVVAGLEINQWRELGAFSQKQRDLILKISGYSELAWGSRGVDLAHDLPQAEWQRAIERALERFSTHPMLLQRFHKGRLVDHPYLDPTSGEIVTLRGRVRLCPYYFLEDGKAKLRGVLATVCPADKKLLHGMKDAVIVPARVAEDGIA